MSRATRRWPLIVAGTLAAFLVVAFIAFQVGIKALKSQVEQALGPYGEVKEIRVSLTGVEVIGIRIRAPGNPGNAADWPAEDQLRAERILIVPALRDLLSARVVVHSIRVEGAYLSMLRSKDGRMRVLPSLLERPLAADPKSNTPSVSIGRIELIDSVVEFFDATVRQPPFKIRLEQINANLENLQLPDIKGQSKIAIDGVLKGIQHDGKINISGPIELASKESELTTRLRGVDLVALQPYLIKAAETGVRKGTLDLDLKSTVRKGALHAPGSLTLNGLELVHRWQFFHGDATQCRGLVDERQKRANYDQVRAGWQHQRPAFFTQRKLHDPCRIVNGRYAWCQHRRARQGCRQRRQRHRQRCW